MAKAKVFLNIPYDRQFTRLYVGYIAALSALGFVPKATLGITGNRRLDRIAALIERCEYSIHESVAGATGSESAAYPTLQHAV
jgi:hypothetical protein